MTVQSTSTGSKSALLNCPFCDEQPSFTDVELKDDRRYAEKLLRCCSMEMSATLSFGQYKGLTDAQIDHQLRSELVKGWNTRAQPVSAAQAAPEGWKLVPLIPDESMIEVGCENNSTQWDEGTDLGFAADVANDVYVSMVRAAPQPASNAYTGTEAKEALEALAEVANLYDEREDDNLAIMVDCDQPPISALSLGHCRKARAALKGVALPSTEGK